MMKLIIFDLDGVLIDAKDIHYEALNKAIKEVGIDEYGDDYNDIISREEHLSKYDGLNTKAKLDLLYHNKKLSIFKPGTDNYKKIFDLKQKYTSDSIFKLKQYAIIYDCLNQLKQDYKLCVASNSISNTVRDALYVTGYIEHFDFYLSNEDVKHPKPNTEIYLQAMIKAGVSPKETLIIEDSLIGRQGAEQTGALVMGVNSPKDVTYENIKTFIDGKKDTKTKWKDPKLNILIPMAGLGSRFSAANYTFPKPLIEVHGKPMIQVVVENLNIEANYIFLVQKEHYEKYNLKTMLNLIAPDCKIVIVDGITEGAACTALLAKEYINNDNPLLIANSDQVLEWNSSEFMYSMAGDHVDGGIVTFKATHPKWSFAKLNDQGFVTEVAEKNPISDTATAGVYYWKKGWEFVAYTEKMISKNIRTNNEFYIAPSFNEIIQNHGVIKPFNIDKMWGIGTPEDLNYYLENYGKSNSK